LKILVLGLGNDLYGDDGVGFHVVRTLRDEDEREQARPGNSDGVVFLECPISGLALLEVILGYDALIIVDTILKPDPVPGRIHFLEGADIRDCPGPSPHYVSIPQTLAIGRRLGLRMPGTVKIVAVEAQDPFQLGDSLSGPMALRLPDIVAATRTVLRALSAGDP
jgi:hydrogenase maturation protease